MVSAPDMRPRSSFSFGACFSRWVSTLLAALKRNQWVVLVFVAGVILMGGIERGMGRPLLAPDGTFALWEGSIWSDKCSQRVLDPYSPSHIAHGMVLYGVLRLLGRKLPVRQRLLLAVLLEAGWELLENSPIIIHRYRQVTIGIGYEGDSVLNSISDVLMMSLGFVFTWRFRPWITVLTLIAMEIGCAWWVRDNLTLNIIMLLHPVEAIKAWQMSGQPLP